MSWYVAVNTFIHTLVFVYTGSWEAICHVPGRRSDSRPKIKHRTHRLVPSSDGTGVLSHEVATSADAAMAKPREQLSLAAAVHRLTTASQSVSIPAARRPPDRILSILPIAWYHMLMGQALF